MVDDWVKFRNNQPILNIMMNTNNNNNKLIIQFKSPYIVQGSIYIYMAPFGQDISAYFDHFEWSKWLK